MIRDEAIMVQNSGKGFFSRSDYADISPHLLNQLLPSFEDCEDTH